MTVLDVGQGLAVVVETHRHALLYDTGPRFTDDADAGGRIVAPYLRATGIAPPSAADRQHQDTDHSGGALIVLQTVPVDWLASSLPADNAILRVAAPTAAPRCAASPDSAGRGTACASSAAASAGALRDSAPQAERPLVRRADRFRLRQRASDRRPRGAQRARARSPRARRAAAPTCWSCRIMAAGLRRRPRSLRRSRRRSPCLHRLPQSLRPSAPGHRCAVRRSGRPQLSHGLRWRAYVRVRTRVPRTPRAEREHDRRYWRDAPERDASRAVPNERGVYDLRIRPALTADARAP